MEETMAYCLSCGKNKPTHNGLCAECASDMDVSGKRTMTMGKPHELTIGWIRENAKRYKTQMAYAFLKACDA